MKCPSCDIEMAIKGSKNVVEGDTSADVETKLYVVQELTCRNKNCPKHGTIVKIIKNEIPLSKD